MARIMDMVDDNAMAHSIKPKTSMGCEVTHLSFAKARGCSQTSNSWMRGMTSSIWSASAEEIFPPIGSSMFAKFVAAVHGEVSKVITFVH
jgi:hypothetical protein